MQFAFQHEHPIAAANDSQPVATLSIDIGSCSRRIITHGEQ
ncbi:hypothetical protein V1279_000282 [Bradyrhizobium sp. AZCC 1610]